MFTLVEIGTSLFPVFILLGFLVYFDSFKLVKLRDILITILFGSLAALLSLLLNRAFLTGSGIEMHIYVRYLAPFLEEALKMACILFLFQRKKIGFSVDGAIYGFAQNMNNAYMNRIKNSTPINGLYLASAWGFPGGGFQGVIRGGGLCFQKMMEDWGTRSPSALPFFPDPEG